MRDQLSNIHLLTHIAERNGWPTTQQGSLTHKYVNDSERFQSWAVETLLWAYQRNGARDKFKALCQVMTGNVKGSR